MQESIELNAMNERDYVVETDDNRQHQPSLFCVYA